MLKYLRIAVTALGMTACVLLIVLWVRSYYYRDCVGGPPTSLFTSWRGRLFTGGRAFQTIPHDGKEPSNQELRAVVGVYIITTLDQDNLSYDGGYSLPIAALVFLMGTVAAAPWLRWRFSLRTLLIATTLVAVVLGTVIYFSG